MKQKLQLFTAAILGGLVVSLATHNEVVASAAAASEELRTRRLVVVNENGRAVVTIDAQDGEGRLTFYSSSGTRAIDIGSEGKSNVKFVRIIGPDDKIVAAMTSYPPDGSTTLVLGERRWGAHVVLGAIDKREFPRDEPATQWGLDLRKPGLSDSLARMVVRSIDPADARAEIRVRRADGTIWAVE